MFQYAVCKILGKLYKIYPGKPLWINWDMSENKNIEADLLMISDDGKLKIGSPFLKEKLKFNVLENKVKKIRVAKYHAKSNYRKVKGQRINFAKIVTL